MKFEVLFFHNGHTAYLKNGNQAPELQESWFNLYIKFLEEKGINPLDGIYKLPAGDAEVFKTEDGYNWRFINENKLIQ